MGKSVNRQSVRFSSSAFTLLLTEFSGHALPLIAERSLLAKATSLVTNNFMLVSGMPDFCTRLGPFSHTIHPSLHECDVCLKRFSQASGLKTHMNTQYVLFASSPFCSRLLIVSGFSSKEKPFACEIGNCKAAFGDPSSRARHRKETHRRLVPYRCSVLGCRSRYVTALTFVGVCPK